MAIQQPALHNRACSSPSGGQKPCSNNTPRKKSCAYLLKEAQMFNFKFACCQRPKSKETITPGPPWARSCSSTCLLPVVGEKGQSTLGTAFRASWLSHFHFYCQCSVERCRERPKPDAQYAASRAPPADTYASPYKRPTNTPPLQMADGQPE